jgi:hypothetical protein
LGHVLKSFGALGVRQTGGRRSIEYLGEGGAIAGPQSGGQIYGFDPVGSPTAGLILPAALTAGASYISALSIRSATLIIAVIA